MRSCERKTQSPLIASSLAQIVLVSAQVAEVVSSA
jgi:hypothetical protein